jgi:hypothetical protein
MSKGEALALMQQGYRSEVRRKLSYLGGDEWLLWPCFCVGTAIRSVPVRGRHWRTTRAMWMSRTSMAIRTEAHGHMSDLSKSSARFALHRYGEDYGPTT